MFSTCTKNSQDACAPSPMCFSSNQLGSPTGKEKCLRSLILLFLRNQQFIQLQCAVTLIKIQPFYLKKIKIISDNLLQQLFFFLAPDPLPNTCHKLRFDETSDSTVHCSSQQNFRDVVPLESCQQLTRLLLSPGKSVFSGAQVQKPGQQNQKAHSPPIKMIPLLS